MNNGGSGDVSGPIHAGLHDEHGINEKTQGLHSNDQNTVPVNFYRDIFPLLALAVREAVIELLQHFWRLLSLRLLW